MKPSLTRRCYFSLVLESLRWIGRDSQKDGLAYLVATSKPEYAIRDRLAFRLQQALKTSRTVARELSSVGKKRARRVDIAILDGQGKCDVAIQLKARSAAKLQRSRKIGEIAHRDLQKCKGHRARQSLYLLLAPLVESSWDETVPALDRAIVDALRGTGVVEGVKSVAAERVEKAFPASKWKFEKGTIQAGKVFGARISVLWWLCERQDP